MCGWVSLHNSWPKLLGITYFQKLTRKQILLLSFSRIPPSITFPGVFVTGCPIGRAICELQRSWLPACPLCQSRLRCRPEALKTCSCQSTKLDSRLQSQPAGEHLARFLITACQTTTTHSLHNISNKHLQNVGRYHALLLDAAGCEVCLDSFLAVLICR